MEKFFEKIEEEIRTKQIPRYEVCKNIKYPCFEHAS